MSERERPPQPEPASQPYYLASQFFTERTAGKAYEKAQEAIYNAPPCDVSVFRFMIPSRHSWLVTVIGRQPDAVLERRLRRILASGTPATVPDDILQLLQQRRAEATQQAPWVERHFPPQTHN